MQDIIYLTSNVFAPFVLFIYWSYVSEIMSNSSISIDIDDPRTGQVAEALANKTCVKILGLLAEQEYTAGDIASKLGIPLNTTGYNIEKLIAAGLVEKTSNFFWSVKGKKTPTYRVANRRIVISPKRVIKGVVPAVLLSGVGAVILRYFTLSGASQKSGIVETFSDSASGAASFAARAPEIANAASSGTSVFGTAWSWFFIGALFSLIVLFLWDWANYWRKNI